eukprot:2073625-Prymnesium_polylepis.2
MALSELSHDLLSLLSEHLDARDIYALHATSSTLRAARTRLVGGRVRHYWRNLYRTSSAFRESKCKMSIVDLARTEAQIHAPFGACVCCLRDGPKLGARCVDCVANEKASFAKGSAEAATSTTRCAHSHTDMVFTCVLCESSTCLECLCNDAACSMCRHAAVAHDCDEDS